GRGSADRGDNRFPSLRTSPGLLLLASSSASCQANPSRETRSSSAGVATAFQASDLGTGPTSTLGLTPGGSLGFVAHPFSDARIEMLVTMAMQNRAMKQQPSACPRLQSDSRVSEFQPTRRSPPSFMQASPPLRALENEQQ